MINHYEFSLIGSSHSEKGKPCQDAHKIGHLDNNWIIAAISDGLGSCKFSDIASKIAVNTSIEYISERFHTTQNGKEHQTVLDILKESFNSAQQRIINESEKRGDELSEFDCTLTALLYDGNDIYYAHCGDGGIIALDEEGEYHILTNQHRGEYSNMVNPLRAGESEWDFKYIEGNFASVSLMTDGLFDYAVNPLLKRYHTEPIWIDFIAPFMQIDLFRAMDVSVEKRTKILASIEEYLQNSESLTKSITDDKTIVVLANQHLIPKIKKHNSPDWKEIEKRKNEELYNNDVEQKHKEKKTTTTHYQKNKDCRHLPRPRFDNLCYGKQFIHRR